MRYLSDEWLERADAELRDLPALDVQVVVGFTVSGGPEGDRAYSLRLGPHPVRVITGTNDAGVTFRLDWELASDIARGAASAQRAFLDGELVLGGDIGLILGHQQALATIDDRLASLRDETVFS